MADTTNTDKKNWLKRWQEFTGWLPLAAVTAVIGWLVLVPLARVSPELMSWLAELPVYIAYALAASGLAYLSWRRWSIRLTHEDIRDYWARLMEGDRGALVVFVTNAAFYVLSLAIFLAFFWPAR